MVTALLVVGIALISGPPTSTADTTQALEAIAARQLELAAKFDTLSYTAVLNSATPEESNPQPFHQKSTYTYSRRGTAQLFTIETANPVTLVEQRSEGKVGEPLRVVGDTPLRRKILVTDELLLYWGDESIPLLQLYKAEDWLSSDRSYKYLATIHLSGGDLRAHCFGDTTPFHELLPRSPEFTTWSLTEINPKSVEVKRTLALGQGKSLQDLTLYIDPASGLLSKALSGPGAHGQSDCALAYTEFPYRGETMRVPTNCQAKVVDSAGVVVESHEVQFSDFRDELDLPAYTMNDLLIPEGAEIEQCRDHLPSNYFNWEAGTLKPSTGPDRKLRGRRP